MSLTNERVLITGGAGFIGCNLVAEILSSSNSCIVTLDKLSYCGKPANLERFADSPRHELVVGDIGDRLLVRALLDRVRPDAIVNLAAETHVDRSITGPEVFVRTNVYATSVFLEEACNYWSNLPTDAQRDFRFLHVSTDEVYGTLGPSDGPFTEASPFAPNSPYAATKAGADHLVRAFFRTYGLPTLATNCSNNYGPFQYPEKLIPLMILNGLCGQPLPVYGDGSNIRDWLYVGDHCKALVRVLQSGRVGETYNVGGHSEVRNIDVVLEVCRLLDELCPRHDGVSHERQITHVRDRPGHDFRYAIDSCKLQHELGWRPMVSFRRGLRHTVQWYLDNSNWLEAVTAVDYRAWIDENYGRRDQS